MNREFVFIFIIVLLGLTSCSDTGDDDDATGNWSRWSDYLGDGRSSAAAFVIGDDVYVGMGENSNGYLSDFYRFAPGDNDWYPVAPFPGLGRIAAASFSIGDKGYVGTGYNEDQAPGERELADFWEYNAATDEWTQIADFGGGARYNAVAFSIGNRGYVGTGYDGSYLKDFWSYNPAEGTWTNAPRNIPTKRESAVAFVVDDMAYVGTGRNNGSYLYDFYAYDPVANAWTDLTLYDDDDDSYDVFVDAMTRYAAVAFELDGLGYIATGVSDSYSSEVFSYNPSTNTWSDDLTSFEGSSRSQAVAFNVNGKAFISTGRNSTYRWEDIWSFQPGEEYDEWK